jgi:hypothetical protein
MKFIPHRIGKEVWQIANYQTIKVYIIQLVQKSFRNGKDVADSIRKMERIDMTTKIPVRKISGALKAVMKRPQSRKDMTSYTRQR